MYRQIGKKGARAIKVWNGGCNLLTFKRIKCACSKCQMKVMSMPCRSFFFVNVLALSVLCTVHLRAAVLLLRPNELKFIYEKNTHQPNKIDTQHMHSMHCILLHARHSFFKTKKKEREKMKASLANLYQIYR